MELECSVNVFLIFWKDSERFSMFSYVVSIILMWPIFYIYGECQKYFLLLFFSSEIQNIFQWNKTSWCEVSSFSESRGHLCKYLFCKLEAGYLSFELLQLLCEQAVAFVNLFSNNLMLSRTLQLSNLRSIMSIVTCSWTMICRCR